MKVVIVRKGRRHYEAFVEGIMNHPEWGLGESPGEAAFVLRQQIHQAAVKNLEWNWQMLRAVRSLLLCWPFWCWLRSLPNHWRGRW